MAKTTFYFFSILSIFAVLWGDAPASNTLECKALKGVYIGYYIDDGQPDSIYAVSINYDTCKRFYDLRGNVTSFISISGRKIMDSCFTKAIVLEQKDSIRIWIEGFGASCKTYASGNIQKKVNTDGEWYIDQMNLHVEWDCPWTAKPFTIGKLWLKRHPF